MDNILNLNEIRCKINSIDKEMVALLEERFNLVVDVGEYKKLNKMDILDAGRESIVIEKCKENLNNKHYEKYLENIFLEIINTCKDIQRNEI